MEFLLIFIARCCGDSSSWHRTHWLGILLWSWDPSFFRGELHLQSVPPVAQHLPVGLGSVLFESLPLLPVLIWPLLYILSYRHSVQLVFR